MPLSLEVMSTDTGVSPERLRGNTCPYPGEEKAQRSQTGWRLSVQCLSPLLSEGGGKRAQGKETRMDPECRRWVVPGAEATLKEDSTCAEEAGRRESGL